jgi:lysozyme family protein
MRYSAKWPVYAKQWDAMAFQSRRVAQFDAAARVALANKPRYLAIAARTGVTWPHIAVLHRRESDADFTTYLGNGNPLNHKTTDVPEGRGPFKTFEDGAIDALHVDGLDSVKDWRLEKILYYCELFNGTGYDRRGLPSPYVWSGSTIQRPGKYVSDGKWDGRRWDTQPGCAPLIATIAKLDPSITFTRET